MHIWQTGYFHGEVQSRGLRHLLCQWRALGRSPHWERGSHTFEGGGQDGSVVQLHLKRHAPCHKLRKAHCEQQGLPVRQIGFQLDGQPISESNTIAQWEMENAGTMGMFQQQAGGVCYAPGLCSYRPRTCSHLENCTSVPSHAAHCSGVCSVLLFFPCPFLYRPSSHWCMCTNILQFVFSFSIFSSFLLFVFS